MKCEICNNEIKTTFLKKLLGTVVKDENGKKHYICQDCQRENKDKKLILEKI